MVLLRDLLRPGTRDRHRLPIDRALAIETPELCDDRLKALAAFAKALVRHHLALMVCMLGILAATSRAERAQTDRRSLRCGPAPRSSVVQNHAQQRAVDLEPVLVVDESESLELVHEEVHAGSCGSDDFRQRFLRYGRQHTEGLVVLAIP
jgi:hypothetical protein